MTIIIILIGIIVVLFCIIYFQNRSFTITNYELSYDNLPKKLNNTRFVLISDLHEDTYGENNQKLIEAIYKENPDFIIIAGDLIVGSENPLYENSLELLRTISKDFKIYYANGNHEQRLTLREETNAILENNYWKKVDTFGISHLINETTFADGTDSKLALVGLEIENDYFNKFKRPEFTLEYLEQLVGKKENDVFTILVAHNPAYFSIYSEWGADLVVSGHVHGGLVRIPCLGGVISPQLVLFPKYDAGLFKKGKSKMVLSRGLGSHTFKLRLFNKPEMVVIKLKKQSGRN